MKRAIAALVLVVLFVFLASSISSSLLSDQVTYTKTEIPNDKIGPTANAKTAQNAENLEENVSSSGTTSEEAKTSQSVASVDPPHFQSETSQGANARSDTIPPDGAIYYGGEPPYAYIPTYDPREPYIIRIPNAPPEP